MLEGIVQSKSKVWQQNVGVSQHIDIASASWRDGFLGFRKGVRRLNRKKYKNGMEGMEHRREVKI